MSNRKAIFLDVDGTLVNDFGQVPDSATRVVRQARANGHLVFLCTGRSIPELWPEILDIGFDGVIAGSGAYVQAGQDVLVHQFLATSDAQHVVDFFASLGVDYFLQTDGGIYGSAGLRARLGKLIRASAADEDMLAELERGLFGFVQSIKVNPDLSTVKITKVIYVDSSASLEEVQSEFAGTLDVLPSSVSIFGPSSGEMTIPGIHKATGIDVVIEHFGIDRDDTLAIGDNFNDLEMLAHVAVGIAMGNAPAEVKAVADEVTTSVDDHGVATAFRRHGLVGRPS